MPDPTPRILLPLAALALWGVPSARAQKPVADPIQTFTAVLQKDPRRVEAFVGRARAYLAQKQFAKAAIDFTWAIQLRPDDADHYASRAEAYRLAGDLPHAIADADQVVARQPDAARGYRLRAELHAAGRDWEKALADCDRGVQLATDDPAARVRRARLRLQWIADATGPDERPLGQRYVSHRADHDAALTDLEAALLKRPDNATLRGLHLALLLEKQDWSGARDAALQSRDLPGAAIGDLLATIGYCQFRQDDPVAAMKTCREALAKDPGNPGACLTLSLLYALRGEPDATRKAQEIGLRRAKKRDIVQHASDLERLLATSPDNLALQSALATLRSRQETSKEGA